MNLSRTPWTLLVTALLLITCSPEYQSGITVCAEKEPRCPEGFVCNGIRCYLAGQAPDGGAVLGGSGGADAAAGGGGTAGMAMGGRGGMGGAGGAGGRGGSSGTGGAGGTSGTGGNASFPPAPMCASLMPDDDCDRCQFSLCCTELASCSNNPACVTFVRCVNACPDGDTACVQQCGTSNAAGLTAFTPFAQCLRGKCDQPCSGPSPMPPMPPPVRQDAGPPPPPAADAGSPPSGPASIKFCNRATNNGASTNEELQIGTIKLRAATGQCTPMPGTACMSIAPGTYPLTLKDVATGEDIIEPSNVTLEPGSNRIFVDDPEELRSFTTQNAAQCASAAAADFPP